MTGFDKILLAPPIVKTTKFSLHGFLTRLKSCFHDILKKLESRTETETFFCTKKEMYKTNIYKRLQVELKIYKGDTILRIFQNNNHCLLVLSDLLDLTMSLTWFTKGANTGLSFLILSKSFHLEVVDLCVYKNKHKLF